MATRARGRGTAQPHNPRPEGEARLGQVVTTFGPGAPLDLVDHAVIVGGLDFWKFGRGAVPIHEPRLYERLLEPLRKAGRTLDASKPFLSPPAGSDTDRGKYCGIPALELPRWFVCQAPDCRALVRGDQQTLKGNSYFHDCGKGRALHTMVPVRFLGACVRGHIDDFPWVGFVHRAAELERCAAPRLQLRDGASGDFSEVFESLRLLVRTASNAYFSQVVSALSIPAPGRNLADVIDKVWNILQVATAETLATLRAIPDVTAALGDASDAEVMAAIEAKRADTRPPTPPLRSAEYQQLCAAPNERPGELPPAGAVFFARQVAPQGGLPDGINKLVLLPRLREVRAQVGFTRLEPASADLQGEYDLEVRSAPLGADVKWLPATEVHGEGMFLQLDAGRLAEWEMREAVQAREDALKVGYRHWLDANAGSPDFPGIRFYLLHTLAHLLVSVISLECGYAASALRERIYAGPVEAGGDVMAGLLLSTGTSGAEGTLGGLVEQGRRLPLHLASALEFARLCSNDPVCGAHSPQDLDERYLEGAACHGCLYIAESSCERANRFLDRALVVPVLGQPASLAFF